MLTTTLQERKEAQVIRIFHEIVDDYNVISGSDSQSRPVVYYEFHERATIAKLLSHTASNTLF